MWGSAWWLRYLFHLKLLIECVIRESSQTLDQCFRNLELYAFPALPIGTVIVSQAATIGSELRDDVYFNNCTFPSRHVLNSDTFFLFKNYVKKRLQYRHPIKHTFSKNVCVVLLNGPPKKCNTYYFLFDWTFRKEQRERQREREKVCCNCEPGEQTY